MPLSSPATNMPGTLVSCHSSISGTSLRDLMSPSPTVIAPTGQAISQRACPTQRRPLTTVATPPTTPSTSPSGHASTQLPQPMQYIGSTKGNWAIGRSMPSWVASVLRARSL